jgi:hypothetical protein
MPERGSKGEMEQFVEAELARIQRSRDLKRQIEEGMYGDVAGKDAVALYILGRALDRMEQRAMKERSKVADAMVAHLEEHRKQLLQLASRIKAVEEKVAHGLASATQRLETAARATSDVVGRLAASSSKVQEQLEGGALKDLRESDEQFRETMKDVVRDVTNAFNVASRTNLMVTELSKKVNDVSADISALEESLRLEVKEATGEAVRGRGEDSARVLRALDDIRGASGGGKAVEDLAGQVRQLGERLNETKMRLDSFLASAGRRLESLDKRFTEVAERSESNLSRKVEDMDRGTRRELREGLKDLQETVGAAKASLEVYGPLLTEIHTTLKALQAGLPRAR